MFDRVIAGNLVHRASVGESSSYYDGTRREVAKFLPERYAKVLEIGCGEGGFHANLVNCEYWGIEPTQPAAALASARLFKVINASYEEAFDKLPDSYFDLIICNDVMEHMPDHDKFFQTIKQKMAANSYIVGSVPNVRFIGVVYKLLFLKDWEYENQGILDRTHLRFFTETSLKRTFQAHGFVIEALGGVNQVEFTWMPLRVLLKNALILLLGKDTRSYQFGFRIKLTHHDRLSP
jgi:SAM-dependent methyltransferase